MGGDKEKRALQEQLEWVFEALSNENRRRILEILDEQPWPSQEIARRLDCSWPTVSRHLRVLEKARLIRRYPGELSSRSIFGLDDRGLAVGRAWLGRLRGDALPF